MTLSDSQLITKLKYRFGEKFPFLASLSNNVELRLTDKPIPLPSGGETVACCSDTEIIIFSDFINESFDKAMGVYAHEVMHIALMHTVRYNEYVEQGLGHEWRIGYNILADLRINELLKHEGIKLPADVIDTNNINKAIEQAGFKQHKGIGQLASIVECVNADDLVSTDRAFSMFRNFYKYEGPKGGGQSGKNPSGGNKIQPSNDLQPGKKKSKTLKEDVERKIVSDLVGSQSRGSGSGNLRRMFEKQFYKKEIDYSKVIKNSLVSELQKVIDYNQPHRKSIELDFEPYLPRWKDMPNKYHVAIGIDSSGSMGTDTINKICGELFKLVKRYPVAFDVFVCDDEIKKIIYDIKSVDGLKKIKEIRGGGGTSFTPVFKEIEKAKKGKKGRCGKKYKTLIYFTDGYGDNDELKEVKGLKTFWVIDDQGGEIKFPFGKVCMIK
jgi:predicted metal-dependent peptidase